jgi:Family of unknown function (DUF6064)
VQLPFTPDQFFGVFAEYNRRFWPIAIVLWIMTAATLVATRQPNGKGRALNYLLSALWMWNAVAYHALLFTQINPAAWLFAGLFGVQSLLLLSPGLRGSMSGSTIATPPLRWVGMALLCYALAYPLLSLSLGHGYPGTPTFGVPCPTAILTIGILLTVWAGASRWLSVIPALWGLVGGSAAVLLAVWTDYVLLGAGVLLVLVLVIAPFHRL